MKIKLALIVATLFAASAASATDLYVGGSLGQSRSSLVSGPTADKTDGAGKVLIGAQFNRNFGLEASYSDLGESSVGTGIYKREDDIKSGALDLVATLPLTERFGILGRVGVARTSVASDFAVGKDITTRSTGLHAGVGAKYDLTRNLALRGEFEATRVKDFGDNRRHVNLVSVGLVYTFGGKPAPVYTKTTYVAPAPAPAPVYVAPAPAPAPVVEAPAPAPVVTKKKVRE